MAATGPFSREGSLGPGSARGAAQQQPSAFAGGAGAGAGSRLHTAEGYAHVPLDVDTSSCTADSLQRAGSLSRPGVFSGLWFTLAAVTGSDDEQAATRLVR